jgi:large subunit ribosomal protein L15
MAITLHTFKNNKKKRKVLGRGNSSGRGTYCTRGLKGQRARSGGKKGLKLKGFKQNLLNLPKYKGTKSIRPNNQIVKLGELETAFGKGEQVTPGTLFEKKLISTVTKPVKLLSGGDLTKDLQVFGCLASAVARELIEKAGGKFITIEESTQDDTIKEDTKK